jgi:hypothetical protein
MIRLNCIRILASPVPEGWPDTYNEHEERRGMVEDLNLGKLLGLVAKVLVPEISFGVKFAFGRHTKSFDIVFADTTLQQWSFHFCTNPWVPVHQGQQQVFKISSAASKVIPRNSLSKSG